jgi:hypothetical protein
MERSESSCSDTNRSLIFNLPIGALDGHGARNFLTSEVRASFVKASGYQKLSNYFLFETKKVLRRRRIACAVPN